MKIVDLYKKVIDNINNTPLELAKEDYKLVHYAMNKVEYLFGISLNDIPEPARNIVVLSGTSGQFGSYELWYDSNKAEFVCARFYDMEDEIGEEEEK
jgi:hypothetical protein